MSRLLVIPAAGRGSRLGWNGPKALCPVNGRPMLDYLLDRYSEVVERVVIVAAPAAVPQFEEHLRHLDISVDCVVQDEPTGMLPAILCARPLVERHRPAQVWITWCDQIAISAETVHTLAAECTRHADAAVVLPTVRQTPPYIHFSRNDSGQIAGVLQRREGDRMPPEGESDAGLFALRLSTFLHDLSSYDAQAASGSGTRERNFLPFIPWMAARSRVHTFLLDRPEEAVGVNTPADLDLMERYLRGQ